MKKYTHLESKPVKLESDWNKMFFRKMHAPAAFENSLTSNIVLTVEKMLSIASAQIRKIIKYKQL